MFYRTSSPSAPLPCLSFQLSTKQSRASGIADHILPLGDWFSLLGHWRANLFIQTLPSRAGELDGNKRAGLWSSKGPSRGLKGPKTVGKDQNLPIFHVLFVLLQSRWTGLSHLYHIFGKITSFIRSYIHPIIHPFVYSSIHTLIDLLTNSFIHSLFHWLMNETSYSLLEKLSI